MTPTFILIMLAIFAADVSDPPAVRRLQEEGGPASVEEIILCISGLVAAGTETTSLGSTMALRTLFRHPEQMEELRADRSLLPNAVRELLRYDFGAAGLPRYALCDF